MYIGLAFWDCGELFVSAWVNGEPVIVPTADGRDSISAESFYDELGELVVGEHRSSDDPSVSDYNYYWTFSQMVSAGIEVVSAFLETAVNNAEELTGEKVDGICVAIPAVFDDYELEILTKAADKIEVQIFLMQVGDIMAYHYASSQKGMYDTKCFAILHNDSQYAEFGIYEIKDQSIIKYLLKEIPSPLKTISLYIKQRIVDGVEQMVELDYSEKLSVELGAEIYADQVVEGRKKGTYAQAIDLSEFHIDAKGIVLIQWSEICETYAQLFRNALHETERLPKGVLDNPIEVINGGFTYDWKIVRSAYLNCGLFTDLPMDCNTRKLAMGACAYLAAQNGITNLEVENPYLNYDVTAYTIHEKVLLLNYHQFLPETVKKNIMITPDNSSVLVDFGGRTVLHANAEITEPTVFQINVTANKDFSFEGVLINQTTGERIEMDKGFGGIKERIHYQQISFVEPSDQETQKDLLSDKDQEVIPSDSNHYLVKWLSRNATNTLAFVLEGLVKSGARDEKDIKEWLKQKWR